MAKKKAAADPGNGVEFDVPDDVFGPDGDVGDTDAPEPEAKADADADDSDVSAPPPKDKAPKVQAREEEPEEEPEIPPLDAPNDPAFLLAEERARRLELEQRMAVYEASQKQSAKDPEAEEDKALLERKKDARDKAMRATREGDEAVRQEAMWELGDLEREEYRRDSARQLRELRSAREGGQAPQQAGLSPQQRAQIEAETFRAAHRVTSEEERAMEVAWAKFAAKNPAWNNARPWTKFDRALKLVRGSRGTDASGTALVAGGQSAATGKAGRFANKSKDELGARLQGVSVDEYRQVVKKYGRGAR